MTSLHSMFARYENDDQFHVVVDTLVGMILRLEMTPSELRECVMFACMRAETLKPPQFSISGDDAIEFCRRFEPKRRS